MKGPSPHVETLLAVYRDLDDATRARVDAHLATCAACTARLAEFKAVDRAMSGLTDPAPDPAAVAAWQAGLRARSAERGDTSGAAMSCPTVGAKNFSPPPDAQPRERRAAAPPHRPSPALVASAALVLGLIVLVAGGVSGRLPLGETLVRWGRGELPAEQATPAASETPAMDEAEAPVIAPEVGETPGAGLPDGEAYPRPAGDEAALSTTGNGAVFSILGDPGIAISADGRTVAFASTASNLVPGDTNQCAMRGPASEEPLGSCTDVFVRDIETGTTWRASVAADGIETGTTGASLGKTGDELDDGSFAPALTPDGRYLAFRSKADVLKDNSFSDCAVKHPNACHGIYVKDLATGETELLYVLSDGGYADSTYGVEISADGRHVLFDIGGEADPIPGTPKPTAPAGPDRIRLAYDRQTDTVRYATPEDRRALGVDAVAGEASADGRYRVFASHDATLVPGDSQECVRPESYLPANCSDIFITDQVAGTTERLSLAPGGVQADGDSSSPTISADGRYVAFASNAANLLPDAYQDLPQVCGSDGYPAGTGSPYADSTLCAQVYVLDRETGALTLVTRGKDGVGNGLSAAPRVSADGRRVVFRSAADNLVEGDRNGTWDLFLYDRESEHIEAVSAAGPRPHAVYFVREPSTGEAAVLGAEYLHNRFEYLGYRYTEAATWPDVLADDAAQRIDVLVLDPGSLPEADPDWVRSRAADGGIVLGGINVRQGDLEVLVGDSPSSSGDDVGDASEFYSVVAKVRTKHGEWGTMGESPVFDAETIKTYYGDSLEQAGIHWEPWHGFFKHIGRAIGRIYTAELDAETGAE